MYMKFLKLFTKHPNDVGETYITHALQAISIAWKCQVAVFTQLLHAILPFICPPFKTDVCSLMEYLDKKLPENRKRENCK